jgi:hypothetical protein
MTKKKLVFAVLASAFILIFATATQLLAVDVIPVTFEEQLEALQADPYLTEEERDFHISRLRAIWPGEGLMNEVETSALVLEANTEFVAMSSPNQRILNVRHVAQQTADFCGPATIQQTLHFWGATPPTQHALMNTIRTTWGVQFPDIPILAAVVAQNTSRHRYVTSRITNLTLLGDTIMQAVNRNITPMIRMEATGNIAHLWPFPTNGHFLNVSGVEYHTVQLWSDPIVTHSQEMAPMQGLTVVSRVRVTDPFIGAGHARDPGGSPHFWVTLNNLQTVMAASHRGHNEINFAW